MNLNLKKLSAAVALLAVTLTSHATAITIGNAEADFTTGAGTLTIVLKNHIVDPSGVIDNISGVGFTLSSGQTSATLVSGKGWERTVNADGTYSNGLLADAGWVLSGLFLDDLLGAGHAGPAHTLIGAPDASNVYGAANNSITGNGPHNPFLFGDVTFVLNIAGLTSEDWVSSAYFQFGTTPGGTPPPPSVPEGGTTAVLLGLGLVGMSFVARRRTAA